MRRRVGLGVGLGWGGVAVDCAGGNTFVWTSDLFLSRVLSDATGGEMPGSIRQVQEAKGTKDEAEQAQDVRRILIDQMGKTRER